MDESKRPDWRELCVAATTETDPARLNSLVKQIIQALDERSPLGLSEPMSPRVEEQFTSDPVAD